MLALNYAPPDHNALAARYNGKVVLWLNNQVCGVFDSFKDGWDSLYAMGGTLVGVGVSPEVLLVNPPTAHDVTVAYQRIGRVGDRVVGETVPHGFTGRSRETGVVIEGHHWALLPVRIGDGQCRCVRPGNVLGQGASLASH